MNGDVIINFLKGVSLFQNLGPVLLARLADNMGSLKFKRGGLILEEGKQCNNLFVVASGKLELYKKNGEDSEIILRTLNSGDIFGEAHVMDGAALDAGLRAADDSLVLGIDRMTLNSLVRENSEFSKNYIRLLGGRLRESMALEESLLRILLSIGLEVPEKYSVRQTGGKRGESLPQPGEISRVNAPEDQEEDDGSTEVFFRKELACPLCSGRFRTLKPRQKYIMVEKSDDDFCLYYKTVNPLYYEINVCPACGYSFNSSTSGPVKAEIRKSLSRMLADRWKSANYCGIRTLEDAVQTYLLAIECQRLLGADDAVMGRLYLKLGWLYRYQSEKDQEHRCLDKALYHLSRYFEKSASGDTKEEMNLMFLLGQLHFILGDERGAVNWFVRITQHPDKKSYPYIVNRARDSWQEIRKNRN